MDAFDVRCETCRARLRVRDERVLGQIHPCPKCGSMVHIAAPAGWVMSSASDAALAGAAAGAHANPFGIESAGVASAALKQPTGLFALVVRSPAALWSVGGVALLSLAGLGAAFAWHGNGEPAVALVQSVANDSGAASPVPSDEQQSGSGVCAGLAAAMDAQSKIDFPADEVERSADANEQNTEDRQAIPTKAANETATPAVALEKPSIVESNGPVSDATTATSTSNAPRTLKLEPVTADTSAAPSTASDSMGTQAGPQYPPVPENADAKTQPDTASSQVTAPSHPILHFGPTTQDAAHRTNVADQVAMSIKSFDVSDMPLNRVLDMLANMAAVPISVDPAVLSAAEVSLDMKVAVHAHDLSLGKILGGVLRDHNLACDIRDGQLVIVGRPGDASASAR